MFHQSYSRSAFLLTALLVLTLLPVAGLASAQDGTTLTVALVANTSDYNTARPSMEQCAADMGVNLEIIEENTQTYTSSYVLAARTGEPKLDVIMFWDFYIDQLYPMLTALDGSEDPAVAFSDEDRADFIGIGLADYMGHPYIVPYSLDTRVLYYRTDLLEAAGFSEPPKTWDELVTYAQALTQDVDGDGNVDVWGFASLGLPGQVYNTYTFFDFLFENGGDILDEEGKPTFNSPEGAAALQFMVDLKDKYEVMPPDVVTYDNNELHEGFLAGRFAMVNHWPYMWGMVQTSDLAGSVGFAPEPIPADGQLLVPFNRWGFGIPKMSEHKEVAWKLLQCVTGTEQGIVEYEAARDWPLRASVYAAPDVEIPEWHREFSEFVFDISENYAKTVMLPRAGETSQILSDYIDRAMAGTMTPQEALDAAVSDINDLLQ